MFLYGKNSVQARLENHPQTMRKIYVNEDLSHEGVIESAKEKGIPLQRVSSRDLNRMKRSGHLQGIVAEVDKFSYASFDELLYSSSKGRYTFIFLDRIFDPQNLGSIIRTAACLGGFAVVIPVHKACEVTETVLHVASGGENFVPVARITNLSNALRKAKKEGYWVAGTLVEKGQSPGEVDIPLPLCIVLGSEGEGIRHGIKKELDLSLRIPMEGAGLSFNVSVACGILCYEISRARKKETAR